MPVSGLAVHSCRNEKRERFILLVADHSERAEEPEWSAKEITDRSAAELNPERTAKPFPTPGTKHADGDGAPLQEQDDRTVSQTASPLSPSPGGTSHSPRP